MEALAVINQQAAITPGQEITTALFNDFVRFIDRSEKTTRTYLTNLRQFMAWLKYRAIRQPQRQDIIQYREWLSIEHESIAFRPDLPAGWMHNADRNGNPIRIICKPATVKTYLQSVKQFFKWTAANGLYPDIAANIHPPKLTRSHKKDSLTAAQVLKIENAITAGADARTQAAAEAAKDTAGRMQRSTEQGKRLYAMYLLAVNAGLRTVEISRANIRDIEEKDGRAWLYIWGKGRAEADQKKPIVPEVKAAIDDYLQSRTDRPTGASPLFVSTGNRSHGKRIAPTTISTMLKGAMLEAGYNSERLTAHSLRHTAAHYAMEQTGKNIYKAQMYLRHADPATTEIYLDADTGEEDAAIARKIWDRYHGEPERMQTASNREELEQIAATMTPDAMQLLTAIARNIAQQA